MDLSSTDKLMQCPYNPAHRILPLRMARHIIKCRKNYPNANMKVCTFNALHVVPADQLLNHLLECDSRAHIDRELYQRERHMPQVPKVHEMSYASSAGTSTEDWESDRVESSYDPAKNIVYKEFTRPPPPGLSKASRQEWRQKEVERVQCLQRGQSINHLLSPDENGTCSDNGPSKVTSTSGDQSYAPQPLGRGRGRGSLTLQQAEQSSWSSQPCQAQQQQHPVALEDPNRTEFIREKRRLEKKVFEIRKLEKLRENGHQLSHQEEEKVARGEKYEAELATLLAARHIA